MKKHPKGTIINVGLAPKNPRVHIPDICHFFTRTKFLENKIYTEKTRKLRQNTLKIANFLRYYGKMHSKLSIFSTKGALVVITV